MCSVVEQKFTNIAAPRKTKLYNQKYKSKYGWMGSIIKSEMFDSVAN